MPKPPHDCNTGRRPAQDGRLCAAELFEFSIISIILAENSPKSDNSNKEGTALSRCGNPSFVKYHFYLSESLYALQISFQRLHLFNR